MSLSGDCVTEGHVRVEGTVVGNVTANGIELAEGAVVDGDLTVPGTGRKGQVFVVSGHVTGRVSAYIVDVKKTGEVLGGIDAEEATIHGTVKGDVHVRHRLAVASTAVLDGDVHTDRLVMEEGGRVNGTIRMGRASGGGREEPRPEVSATGADGDTETTSAGTSAAA